MAAESRPGAQDNAKKKARAALVSIAASALLTVGKLLAGLSSGSLALLSEAGHGLLDTGATTLTYFAIKAADKPADAEHHWGHGKIEAVSALIETGLLLLLSLVVLAEAAHRLITGIDPVRPHPLAFVVLAVSIVVDLVRWRSLRAIARETRSDALAADALHFSSDLIASCLVLLGLAVASLGFPQGDALAAAGVAVFVAVAGFKLGKRTIDTLVDAAPAGLTERVGAIVRGVSGVADIEQLRLRPTGAQVVGEVAILVDRMLPLEQVRVIKDAVSASITASLPEAAITVHANPKMLDNETVLEKVLLLAARRRLAVHHVTVQEIDGRKSVSLDVEIDGGMRHGTAHDIASSLERAIATELGPDIEVETHIEPLEVGELTGRNCPQDHHRDIAEALSRRAAEDGTVHDVHSVRVRETNAGFVVNYHCRVDPDLTVDQVHEEVDKLDYKIRTEFPDVIRIVGHAEPLKPF